AGRAAHAQLDGRVEDIVPAPQGGHFLTIGGERHHVPAEQAVTVHRGAAVEAGQPLSEGLPNPADTVEHQGIGAGRWAMVQALRDAFKDSGLSVHRRNLELLVRGLVDHVELTDELPDSHFLPGDVVSY